MHSHCLTVASNHLNPQYDVDKTLSTYPYKVYDLRTRDETIVMARGRLASFSDTLLGDNTSEDQDDEPAILECPCEFRKGFRLICAHVFAILNVFQVKRIVRSRH